MQLMKANGCCFQFATRILYVLQTFFKAQQEQSVVVLC